MQYEKTINKILQKLSKELPIAEEGDLLETQKTLYPSGSLPREEKNIIINSSCYLYVNITLTVKTYLDKTRQLITSLPKVSGPDWVSGLF